MKARSMPLMPNRARDRFANCAFAFAFDASPGNQHGTFFDAKSAVFSGKTGQNPPSPI
jgi:hypothetical protein